MTTITTEAAERLAKWCGTRLPKIANALRSFAAERDALQAENARLREALKNLLPQAVNDRYLTQSAEVEEARAALGETQ
jgi:regulator of replication initiation timing